MAWQCRPPWWLSRVLVKTRTRWNTSQGKRADPICFRCCLPCRVYCTCSTSSWNARWQVVRDIVLQDDTLLAWSGQSCMYRVGASFRCRRCRKTREKRDPSRSADAGRTSKAARQERQNHVKQLFSNAHCETHLGVVSVTCFKRPACNLYWSFLSCNVRQLCLLHHLNIFGSGSYTRWSRSLPQWQWSHHQRPWCMLRDRASHPFETHGVEELALEATRKVRTRLNQQTKEKMTQKPGTFFGRFIVITSNLEVSSLCRKKKHSQFHWDTLTWSRLHTQTWTCLQEKPVLTIIGTLMLKSWIGFTQFTIFNQKPPRSGERRRKTNKLPHLITCGPKFCPVVAKAA